MRVIPVLDLMGGKVVRGVAGQRHLYKSIRSPLASSAEPLDVARAFHLHFHIKELYLADLDAIAGTKPAIGIFKELLDQGFELLVDAGLRSGLDAAPLVAAGVSSIVAGLETLQGPQALSKLVDNLGPGRVVFSLDLKNGRALASSAMWPGNDRWAVATEAVGLGVRRLLVLDLACVGIGAGTGTEDFCARVKTTYPRLELIAGGGVGSVEDLLRLQQCGVDGVLVASALHDGRITLADIHNIRNHELEQLPG